MYETTAVLDLPSELERQAPIGMASEVAGVVGWTLVGNERSGLPQAINVETDPDVRSLRESVREEAQAIMDAHVRSLCEGEYDQVPMEADAGGTARKLVALGKAFGKDSPEYEQGWQALLRDCERRVGEAHRVNGWELFARHGHLTHKDLVVGGIETLTPDH